MAGAWVNDVHSKLNATWVRGVVRVEDEDDVRAGLARARRAGVPVCIAGGRHAMGAQAFGTEAVLLDMRGLNRVRHLDLEAGRVEVDAGICWPELVAGLQGAQAGSRRQWGIIQKQTGADRLSLGGALAANIHGRGLRLRPFVDDVHSVTVVGADGETRQASRRENPHLFRLVAGGYGLFGVVTRLTLRLMPRIKLQRVVEIALADDLAARFEERIGSGFLYGDFQFAVDAASDDFLRRGVFSCYRPVAADTPMAAVPRELGPEQWQRLLRMAHEEPSRAFAEYAAYYRSTSGQIYWSDTQQISTYLDDYHSGLDRARGGPSASEMITEVYVPRAALAGFLTEARAALRRSRVPLVYGTIRLIERDAETFLAWARERWACVVFNLHLVHDPEGLTRGAEAFRTLIDLALAAGGSYYLTYHRWARRDQVLRAYPQFPELLRRKASFDPEGRFQSDWYRYHRALLEESRIA
jgi:FAD/FMN-containing dehydrogenase